jgi:hypothetical protein
MLLQFGTPRNSDLGGALLSMRAAKRERSAATHIAISTVVAAIPAIASIVLSAPAGAEIGALMNVGAAFVGVDDVDRIANALNFESLSPGIDGGVVIQFGSIDSGVSGEAGIDAFWSRRRTNEFYYVDGTPSGQQASFQVTALGFPAALVYSLQRGGGRISLGAGVGYYVATVRAQADVSGSNYFASDGFEGERSADGAGLHAQIGYERPTPFGGLGGGIRVRSAKFATDEAPGAAEFEVDLTGVSVFLSLSVRQAAR